MHNDHSINYRKNKRIFKKKKITISCKSYKGDLGKNALTLLSNHFKSKVGNNQSSIKGVLVDTNILTSAHPCYLPPFPIEWDILCLECDINSYISIDNTSLYWSQVQINDTKHFLINERSEKKLEAMLTKSKSWDNFVENINTLKIYAINNGFYSYKDQVYQYKDKSALYINVEQTNSLNQPKVSLVCVHVNELLLFHTVLTFMKLEYPRDQLELVIVTNQKISGVLPDDQRIKVINIGNKVEFGYMLNQGVKCASYENVCHFFEGCYYYTSYVQTMVDIFSGQDIHCAISSDTSLYDPDTKKSLIYNNKCFTNMMYKKKFWSVHMFDDNGSTYNELLTKYIDFRTSCCVAYPSIKLSFLKYKHSDTEANAKEQFKEIPLSLYNLLDKGLQESFDMCIDPVT